MGRHDVVWFDGHVTKLLDASCIIRLDDGEEVLIPMSQVRSGLTTLEVGADVTLGVPRWLADDRDIEHRENA